MPELNFGFRRLRRRNPPIQTIFRGKENRFVFVIRLRVFVFLTLRNKKRGSGRQPRPIFMPDLIKFSIRLQVQTDRGEQDMQILYLKFEFGV